MSVSLYMSVDCFPVRKMGCCNSWCCRKGEETGVQSNSDQNVQQCVIYEVDGMKQILSLTTCNKQPSPKRTDPVDGATFAVLYNYKRRGLRDLDLKKGDLVTVTSYNKEDWSLVYHMTNQLEGLVPSNYIVPFTGIEDKLCYYGSLTATSATSYLTTGVTRDGLFLIRDSSSSQSRYTLSAIHSNTVTHYRIKENENKFSITGDCSFDTIDEMIEYYQRNLLGVPGYTLSSPCEIEGPATADISLIDSLYVFEVDRSKVQFVRIIGKGHFSEVWEGTLDTKPVAIKTIDFSTTDSSTFTREAEIMCRLHHPNLLALRGVCTQSQPFYIINELMPKGDLLRYLRSNILCNKQLLKFAHQIANGMQFLEEKKYIHRDLAARNVLVGENDCVKVADFGLARFIDDNLTPMSYAVPVRWTAPEAYLQRQYTNKSDVWSYGVLLFEIFSLGQVPYSDIESNIDVMNRVKQGHRLHQPPHAAHAIYKLMLETWNENPKLRPNFADVVDQFEIME